MNPHDITIGASDVPGILGLSPWQSPSAVWARLKGLTESQPSDATRRGHTLELGILMEYADRHGAKAYRWQTSHRHLHRQRPPYRAGLYRGPGIEEGRIKHPVYPWAGCRPDAIVLQEDGTRHLVEVKTTRSFRDWQDADGNPILPPHYVVQVQWQMLVTDTQLTHLEAFCTFDDSRRSYTVV
jgi:predicted phage-related endonuclease